MLNIDVTRRHFLTGFKDIDFSAYRTIVIAVSGGGDSKALLTLAHDYVVAHFPQCRLVAVTVDHGLRAAAAAEAEGVRAYCAELGISHVIKKWDSGELTSGVQAAARQARYQLLTEAAQEHDATLVLTGHNLDDQLETIAMRAERSEGRGLAGISRATLYNRSVWFARPLLAVKRKELRDYLRDQNLDWIEDPSNEDTTFERVRMRSRVFSATEQYQILGVQKAAQAERRNHALQGAVLLGDKTLVELDLAQHKAVLSLMARSETGFEAALQALLCWVGQKQHYAPRDVVDVVADLCSRGRNGAQFTAHGCLLSVKKGRLHIVQESRSSGAGQFCFDCLVPDTEFALAKTLLERLHDRILPPIPNISGAR